MLDVRRKVENMYDHAFSALDHSQVQNASKFLVDLSCCINIFLAPCDKKILLHWPICFGHNIFIHKKLKLDEPG